MSVYPCIYSNLPYDAAAGGHMASLGGEVAPMTIQEFVSRQAADAPRCGAFIKKPASRWIEAGRSVS